MAGWAAWDNVQVATNTSVGKTVLETLWGSVTEVARDQGWAADIWVDRLMVLVTEAIIRIKKTESPILDANEDLQEAVRAGEMFANSNFHQNVCRFANVADAEAWFMGPIRANPPVRALPAAIQQVVADRAGIRNLLPNVDNQRPGWGNDLTFAAYIEWLYYTRPDEATATIIGNALISYVAGMCKMGEMTPAWVRSRIAQIRREASNVDLEMSRSVCTFVFDFYGVAFKPAQGQFGQFFAWLQDQCRQKNLTRLYVTALQSAEQGCTVLNLIASAQIECSDFNWRRFVRPSVPAERAMQQELHLWDADFTAMKNNPWLRFDGTTGRSPLMPNLGYLAKQLLTRAIGQTSVQNYAGLDLGNLTIRYKAWIDTVVQAYIDQRNQQAVDPNTPVMEDPRFRNYVHPRLNEQPRFPAAPLINAAVPRPPQQQVAQNIVQDARQNAPIRLGAPVGGHQAPAADAVNQLGVLLQQLGVNVPIGQLIPGLAPPVQPAPGQLPAAVIPPIPPPRDIANAGNNADNNVNEADQNARNAPRELIPPNWLLQADPQDAPGGQGGDNV